MSKRIKLFRGKMTNPGSRKSSINLNASNVSMYGLDFWFQQSNLWCPNLLNSNILDVWFFVRVSVTNSNYHRQL